MSPKRIKTIRKHLELTQKQFAAMLGKSASAVKRWESGRHPMDLTTEKLLTKEVQGVPKMSRVHRP